MGNFVVRIAMLHGRAHARACIFFGRSVAVAGEWTCAYRVDRAARTETGLDETSERARGARETPLNVVTKAILSVRIRYLGKDAKKCKKKVEQIVRPESRRN